MTKYSCRNESNRNMPCWKCCVICLSDVEQCHARRWQTALQEDAQQTGDISHRYDLNVHSYWNPCTSVRLDGVGSEVTQWLMRVCVLSAVAPLRIDVFHFASVFSYCANLLAGRKCDGVKCETLAECIRMLVHLIYWYAVTICLMMLWYDCMHEIAIQMSTPCMTFYSNRNEANQTKPNGGASANANFIEIQITNYKDMLGAKHWRWRRRRRSHEPFQFVNIWELTMSSAMFANVIFFDISVTLSNALRFVLALSRCARAFAMSRSETRQCVVGSVV